MTEPARPMRRGDTPAPAGRGSTTLDWNEVIRLAWRPAWSIRSRRGALAPFLEMLRDTLRRDRP